MADDYVYVVFLCECAYGLDGARIFFTGDSEEKALNVCSKIPKGLEYMERHKLNKKNSGEYYDDGTWKKNG